MIDALLSKRDIRDFLKSYNEKYWKKLIINVIDLGIYTLKSNYNISNLSNNDISDIVFNLKKNNSYISNKHISKQNCIKRKPSSEWRNGVRSKTSDKINNNCTKNSNNIVYENNNYDNINNKNTYLYDFDHKEYFNSNDNANCYENYNNKFNNISKNQNYNNYIKNSCKDEALYNKKQKRSYSQDSKYNIYPDWWPCKYINDYDNIWNQDHEDNSNERNLPNIHHVLNKNYSDRLTLKEKQAIIKRSRYDTPSLGGGANKCDRARSFDSLNAKDRIFDKVKKPDVSSKIKNDVNRDKNFHLRNVANSSQQPNNNSDNNISQNVPTGYSQNINVNVNYSTSPVQSSDLATSNDINQNNNYNTLYNYNNNNNIRMNSNLNESNDRNNLQKRVETNYMISYDKRMRPNQVKEKSVERYIKNKAPKNTIPNLRNYTDKNINKNKIYNNSMNNISFNSKNSNNSKLSKKDSNNKNNFKHSNKNQELLYNTTNNNIHQSNTNCYPNVLNNNNNNYYYYERNQPTPSLHNNENINNYNTDSNYSRQPSIIHDQNNSNNINNEISNTSNRELCYNDENNFKSNTFSPITEVQESSQMPVSTTKDKNNDNNNSVNNDKRSSNKNSNMYKTINQNSFNKNKELDESNCSLSSFTPSERTKEFFQREIMNNKIYKDINNRLNTTKNINNSNNNNNNNNNSHQYHSRNNDSNNNNYSSNSNLQSQSQNSENMYKYNVKNSNSITQSKKK